MKQVTIKAKAVIAEHELYSIRLRYRSIKQASYSFSCSISSIRKSLKTGAIIKRGPAKGFRFKLGTFDKKLEKIAVRYKDLK